MNVAEGVRKSDSATRLVVRCLGRFRLEDQSGNQLHLRTRKARALLAALALNGRPMSRDALADLLWSDRGEAQARASLRQTVFELQHFGSEDAPILVVGRDELAVRRTVLTTDIELIRDAASEGDWARLLALLEEAEPGLLTDLDGLDPEFDNWLRLERGQEPERSLSAAVSAVRRCHAEAGPRASLDLVSAILRIDPVNEEATRRALRIDHELGDRASLHRHYAALRDRLARDYNAEPSAETAELFARLSNGHAQPAQAEELLPPAPLPARAKISPRWRQAIVPLAILLVAVAALLSMTAIRARTDPAAAARPMVIAILPFEQLPAGDGFLAEGMWEDTRVAISRNPNFRVLGRATVRALAERKLSPSEYRSKLGVDYLLEGSVRRNGDLALVSVALTRTSDGVALWEHGFRSRIGDPITFQEEMASGIEGRLRGRLARGGGRLTDQIVTSPEVYAMFNEARALLRTREGSDARRAQALLRQALASDPNFAPAWSSLGKSLWFSGGIGDQRSGLDEARRAVERAIALAPNLADAHATAALLAGENSQAAEPRVRRALALDPSNSEAWNWLGNALNGQSRYREAMQAYRRAVELDPLWFPPVHNFATITTKLDEAESFEWLVGRISSAGASRELIYTTRAEYLFERGDYSGALKLLAAIGLDSNGRPKASAIMGWCGVLASLGYHEAAAHAGSYEDWYGPLQRGERLPPRVINGKRISPADFWASLWFPGFASRAMINLGHGDDVVKLYRRAFENADAFISSTATGNSVVELAPNLAVALRSSGAGAEADYILAAVSERAKVGLKNAPESRGALSRMAFIKAAQGERGPALFYLSRAVGRGWLPDGRFQALDVAQEPAFRELRGDPRFEASRRRILGHIAKERAELGPLKV